MDDPLLAVELRPPRRDQDALSSMESWLSMNAALKRLATRDTAVFLTDSAVGAEEEENLHHLVTNFASELPSSRLCPFLTTKHPLEYCLWYAARALEAGMPAITVLGGDKHVGPPRCVPHGHLLRKAIRARHPRLALGGWANPNRDPEGQAALVASEEFTGDFFLTQIVSHYDLGPVERFVAALERENVKLPAVFGVFHFRSANPKTLATLAEFLPVPVEGLTRDFGRGMSADAICAASIRALRGLGIRHVYVSNLPTASAAERLDAIAALVDS